MTYQKERARHEQMSCFFFCPIKRIQSAKCFLERLQEKGYYYISADIASGRIAKVRKP